MATHHDPFAHPRLSHFWGGYKPTPDDPRDFRLPHLTLRGERVQAQASGSVDLRQYHGQSLMIPIRDQGQVGSCTAFAWSRLRAAAAAKWHIDQGTTPDLGDDISPRFLYDLERSMTGQYPADSGANMRDGGAVLNKYGVAPERYCPYTGKADNGAITTEITAAAYQAALDYGVTTYFNLLVNKANPTTAGLGCLDESWPFVIAILVPPSFENIGHDGRVPMPSKGEQILGGHALCVCGYYFDNSYAGGGCWVVANSWGTSWGDSGYCYIPWAYFTTSAGSGQGNWGQEMWSIR